MDSKKDGQSQKPEEFNEAGGVVAQQFNLVTFTNSLITDLELLRQGKISVRDAQARALLAKHVLRSVHYVVMANKFLANNATLIGGEKDGDAQTSTP